LMLFPGGGERISKPANIFCALQNFSGIVLNIPRKGYIMENNFGE
jgi:hypothetical protein